MYKLQILREKVLERNKLIFQTIKSMEELAVKLRKVRMVVKGTTFAGAGATVAGAVMAGVGVGLSVFKGGSSLLLIGAGAALAGTGGVAAGGSQLGNAISESIEEKKLTVAFERINELKVELLQLSHEITVSLEETNSLKKGWKDMVTKILGVSHCTEWNAVRRELQKADQTFDIQVESFDISADWCREKAKAMREMCISTQAINELEREFRRNPTKMKITLYR